MILTNLQLDTTRGPAMAQLEYRFADQQVDVSQLAVSNFQLGGTLGPLQAEVQAQLMLAPELVIGWTRLIAGRWTDPLVWRDVLVGLLVGRMRQQHAGVGERAQMLTVQVRLDLARRRRVRLVQ